MRFPNKSVQVHGQRGSTADRGQLWVKMSVRLVSEQAEAAASRVAAAESRGRAAVVGVAARVRLLALELAKHSGNGRF